MDHGTCLSAATLKVQFPLTVINPFYLKLDGQKIIPALIRKIIEINVSTEQKEQEESEQFSPSSDLGLEESVNIPHEKVPFQLRFQDKNAINGFDDPYQSDNSDKDFQFQ